MAEIVVTIGGQKYQLDIDDVTGTEARAFHKKVGQSILSGTQGTDLLVYAAGIKWLVDSRTDATATFERILDDITYGQVKFGGDPEQEAEGDPPA